MLVPAAVHEKTEQAALKPALLMGTRCHDSGFVGWMPQEASTPPCWTNSNDGTIRNKTARRGAPPNGSSKRNHEKSLMLTMVRRAVDTAPPPPTASDYSTS
jgi:hypothetical protein